ncbi:hypothetical protein LVD17_24275 [Fulvivirga ulvae]|uniref:hypothetical protein n=1 Tax=Fulvivirga ulvae TaxID=2904245 RepID=UPI001F1C905F|nr:hypothetical protein [Fulvivirga ulvae]UII31413.1 hypothetical protein LVD17_24275 [Fulvivirga ulvae]
MNNGAIAIQNYPQEIDLEQFSKNKVIPDTLRREILTALSYYPELKNTRIHFVFKDNIRKSFMQAQPLVRTMLKSRGQREYVIFISHYFRIGHEKIFIHSVPFGVIVGWLGHELGHVMDYKDRSFFSLLKFGFGYILSKAYLIGAERVADTYAIQHGLAGRIIETKNYILNHADLPERYKSKIRRLYMPPEEVMLMVEAR